MFGYVVFTNRLRNFEKMIYNYINSLPVLTLSNELFWKLIQLFPYDLKVLRFDEVWVILRGLSQQFNL